MKAPKPGKKLELTVKRVLKTGVRAGIAGGSRGPIDSVSAVIQGSLTSSGRPRPQRPTKVG